MKDGYVTQTRYQIECTCGARIGSYALEITAIRWAQAHSAGRVSHVTMLTRTETGYKRVRAVRKVQS